LLSHVVNESAVIDNSKINPVIRFSKFCGIKVDSNVNMIVADCENIVFTWKQTFLKLNGEFFNQFDNEIVNPSPEYPS
jgi:hypothetical protein